MIAQAALESAWGTSALSAEPNHNLFGVKGNYNGQSVNMYTLEDAGAQNTMVFTTTSENILLTKSLWMTM